MSGHRPPTLPARVAGHTSPRHRIFGGRLLASPRSVLVGAVSGRSGAVAYLGRTSRIPNLGLARSPPRTPNRPTHSLTKGSNFNHRRPDGLGKGLS